MLTAYKNNLKQAVDIDIFCIIEVGYFCRNVTWHQDRPREQGRLCDEAIMLAQELLPLEDSDFVLLTQVCKTLSLDTDCINPHAQGHYNNDTMTQLGTVAGAALAELNKNT